MNDYRIKLCEEHYTYVVDSMSYTGDLNGNGEEPKI